MTRNVRNAVIGVLFALFIGACSGVNPSTTPEITDTRWEGYLAGSPSHALLGVWEVVLDADGAVITDVTRSLNHDPPHFNVKVFLKPPKCDDCIKFSNIVDDPVNHIISVDVTIRNPTELFAADLRGILMSSNPEIYLANPDDYTTIHDPDDPPDINPFRLFLKDEPKGIITPFGEATETFELHYDSLPAPFETAIDAIFPHTESREPYAIRNQGIEGALDVDGMVYRVIEVDVFDRHENVGQVSITCEELGLDSTFNKDPANDNHYYTTISNSELSPVGDYTALITACDQEVKWVLYDYLTISVSDELGEWALEEQLLLNGGCSTDISCGFDMMTGLSYVYYPGGTGCVEISRSTFDFTETFSYFNLINIDPFVPGLSPYPVSRMDISFTGGAVFCADTEELYEDDFYVGPISSLIFTLAPDIDMIPVYINPGDGDASRMYPSDPGLRVVDVTDDMVGNVFGLWADPDGVLPPEIYGLFPQYTRHAVFMGGEFPPELVGEGLGKISSDASKLRAFDVAGFGMEGGVIYLLESDGSSSQIEMIQFTVDFMLKITSYQSISSMDLGPIEAVDLDVIMYNPNYLPNPESDTIAVLVKGPSGGYLKMLTAMDLMEVEQIGSESEPAIPGNPVGLDSNMEPWSLVGVNDSGTAVVFSWVI